MNNEEIEKYIEENLGKLKTDFEAKEMIVYRALVEIFKKNDYPESVIINESEYLDAVEEAKGIGNIGISDNEGENDAIYTLEKFGYLEKWGRFLSEYNQRKEKAKLTSREPIMISRFLTIGDEKKIQLVATPIFKAQVFPKKDVIKRLSVFKVEAHWVKNGREEAAIWELEKDRWRGIEEQISTVLFDKFQVDIKRDKLEIKLFAED